MSKKKQEHVPTYYVPAGNEYVGASRNEAAELVVAERMNKGDHIHTWATSTGTLCPTDQCDPKAVAKPAQT